MLESKRRAAIFLTLAFILAAVAGYLVLDKVRSLNAELGGMTSIYVANGNIPSRTLINESQVAKMDIPNRFVTDSHVTNIEDLKDKVLVLPLSKGDIITQNMIKPFGDRRDENNRLIAMYINEKVQFDQVIDQLDRVDIIVSHKVDDKEVTEIFMRDVLVAWANGTGEDFSGVALEVSVDDAPNLIHMQNYADKIRILKANVGRGDTPVNQGTKKEESEEEEQVEENSADANKKESKKTEEKPK